jgi:ATP-binding cassette subfamily B protein
VQRWELQYLNKYFKKYQSSLWLGVGFVFLNNFLGVWQGPVIREAFNSLEIILQKESTTLPTGVFWSISYYGGMILLLTIGSGIFLYYQRRIIIGISRKIEFDLKNDIYQHYQRLPLSFYKINNTGDLMNRISEDVNQVRNYLGPALMYGINLIALFSITVPIMISVNAELAIYTLIPLPFLAFGIYWVQSIITKHSEAIQQQLSELSTQVQETFSGIRVIKSFVRESSTVYHFFDATESYRKKSIRLSSINALFYPIMIFLIGSCVILIIWVGGINVIQGGAVTKGNIAEFIFYLNKLTWPVTSLGWITVLIKRAEVSQKRINEFLKVESTIPSGSEKIDKMEGAIEFKNVRFTYPDTGIQALNAVSFASGAGKTLAIIGNTGSGKSTIASLISRLYEPTEGQILIDHQSIETYDIHSLRQHIGYVPQDVFLFSDTIRNNIAFGAENVSEEEIQAAAQFAEIHDTIMAFPQGYDTILGERGISLSGGQKQRVSIARAVVRHPSLLILDDCLSAVDTKTEDAILQNIKHTIGSRSILIISHRVSSVKLADKIIVLDNGTVMESGTHDELIQLGKTYAHIYQQQLQEPINT